MEFRIRPKEYITVVWNDMGEMGATITMDDFQDNIITIELSREQCMDLRKQMCVLDVCKLRRNHKEKQKVDKNGRI